MRANEWKDWELEDLKKNYGKIPPATLAARYNHKTEAAVTTKAWKLGLSGRKRSKNKSSRDEEILEYVSYDFKPYQIANIMGMNEERVKTIIRGHS